MLWLAQLLNPTIRLLKNIPTTAGKRPSNTNNNLTPAGKNNQLIPGASKKTASKERLILSDKKIKSPESKAIRTFLVLTYFSNSIFTLTLEPNWL